jgi:hypothetical protein
MIVDCRLQIADCVDWQLEIVDWLIGDWRLPIGGMAIGWLSIGEHP